MNSITIYDLKNSYDYKKGYYILKKDLKPEVEKFLRYYISKQLKKLEISFESRQNYNI